MRRLLGSDSSHEEISKPDTPDSSPAPPAPGSLSRIDPVQGIETARPADPVSEEIDRRVIQMFALVEEAVAGATHALLSGDREAARALVANDIAIDAIYLELEELTSERVVQGGLTLAETRWLLAVLSMLPELERSGDLAEHVAQRATRSLPSSIPARSRGFIERMGAVACEMWRLAADAYADRLDSVEVIDRLDDEMDDLHVQFISELVTGVVAVPTAIELALVGRFYERLGDHAVNLTRRKPSRGAGAVNPDKGSATDLAGDAGDAGVAGVADVADADVADVPDTGTDTARGTDSAGATPTAAPVSGWRRQLTQSPQPGRRM